MTMRFPVPPASALLLAALLLPACDDDKPAGDDTGTTGGGAVSDADGDGYSVDEGDCDDEDAAVHPEAVEICDGIDNDCDGETDEDVTTTYYADADGDGFGDPDSPVEACDLPDGAVPNASDCDDAEADSYPGNVEACDGIDNDCDGDVDEDVTTTYYADADGDGFGDPDSPTEACSRPSGTVEDATDCDDTTAAAFPGNAEVCDEIDNDCDGDVDEGVTTTFYADLDGDGYGDPAAPEEACSEPFGYADNALDCDDGSADVSPDAVETCDEIDNDCDGDVDEDDAADAPTWYADADGDGYGDPDRGTTACSAPSFFVADAGDCDDGDADVNPDAVEVCDGVDDDCDGLVDDDDPGVTGTSAWYADGDGDGYGDASVSLAACEAPTGFVADATDCDDDDASSNPGASEACDGVDNDCDGDVDDGVLGTGAACPATDCAEILADNPSAADGDYVLDAGTYTCDMTTDGGGWTLVADAAMVYGTGYDGTYYNTEGFEWTEVLFAYDSGSVHAHCDYPSSLTGCNNITAQFDGENWATFLNWGSSLCGMSTTDYSSATSYIGGYDWVVSRSASTDTIRVGTLEGVANCTTSDNPGTAYIDLWVRR